MKLFKIFMIPVLLCAAYSSNAQCQETVTKTMLEPGMFVCGTMKNESKLYVAEIATAGKADFAAEFLHSRSAYAFENLKKSGTSDGTLEATVETNVGGKYPKGTKFTFAAYMAYPNGCDFNMAADFGPESCISTFPDGKSYLGFLSRKKGVLTITFLHTESVYTFNNNWEVVTVKNGTYKKGAKVKTVYAAEVLLD